MINHLQIGQRAACEISRPAASNPVSQLAIEGRYVVEHWRGGKRINEFHFHNGITNEGKNKLLNVMFNQGTQVPTWWIGLIDNVNYVALANADNYDDINQAGNGWKEFSNYTDANNSNSETTRPEWLEGAASGQSITNPTVAIYDITANGTVKGLFVVGGGAAAQNKGDHAVGPTLWSTALFGSGDVAIQSGDQLKVTYTVSV